ncbi:ANTAR domain-containing response regulator [Christensenella tenuis]|uniref:ANTAR domain-containing protein n=1 Tax=Christensenella tenuis TaxID=2763033 RepID=A0ABR7EDP5_9FIRM|nr:ANTAR domain-containing protein [Christensenella tenuis]MBC5647909.1 ANTAR domain-containing protein [Christensenella tenuis]
MSRILLASGSLKGRDFFVHLIKEYGDHEVLFAGSGKDARGALSRGDIDLLIIHAPLADEFGEELAEHASRNSYCGIIMVAKSDADARTILRVEKAGGLLALTPLSKSLFRQTFRLACATRNRMLGIQNENKKLSRRLEDMGLIDRAKCVLIQVLGMTEPQAHRYIEKQAMDMRVPRRQVAEELLKTYEV